MVLKKATVLFLLVAFLFLMHTSTAFAADLLVVEGEDDHNMWDWLGDRTGMEILMYVGGTLLIIWGFSELESFSGEAGDMTINLHDSTTSSFDGNHLSLHPGSGDAINYDIDWLLTDRREGRIWATTGVTMEFPVTSSGLSFESAEMEGNFKMGYRDGAWDYNLCFSSFTNYDDRAMAWLTYRY